MCKVDASKRTTIRRVVSSNLTANDFIHQIVVILCYRGGKNSQHRIEENQHPPQIKKIFERLDSKKK